MRPIAVTFFVHLTGYVSVITNDVNNSIKSRRLLSITIILFLPNSHVLPEK